MYTYLYLHLCLKLCLCDLSHLHIGDGDEKFVLPRGLRADEATVDWLCELVRVRFFQHADDSVMVTVSAHSNTST